MAKKVSFVNIKTGEKKSAFVGFSWTSFFFLLFVPLLRGDFRYFFGMLVLHLLLGYLTFGIGNIIAWLYQAFTYNKRTVRRLSPRSDWEAADEPTKKMILAGGALGGFLAGSAVHSRITESAKEETVSAAAETAADAAADGGGMFDGLSDLEL